MHVLANQDNASWRDCISGYLLKVCQALKSWNEIYTARIEEWICFLFKILSVLVS